jgi:hypothetical protein
LATIILVGIVPPAPTLAADPPGLARFKIAISRVESGGSYTARNWRTGAYGKYQIIPSSWRAWARLYLGRANAKMTPANQEIVATAKFRAMYRWLHGSWRRVAYAWLTGSSRTYGWSSFARRYVNKVMAYYAVARDPRPPVPPPTPRPPSPSTAPSPTPSTAPPSAPSDPPSAAPSDPAAQSEPVSAAPSDPASAAPSDPGSAAPSDPGSAAPSDPGSAAPSDPSSAAPSDPPSAAPSDAAAPSDPATSSEPR